MKIDKIYLIISGIFFLIAILLQPLNWKLIMFLFSGVLVGLFYGGHNHEVWGGNEPGQYEKIHTYWVHLIGGVVASISAYLLLSKINFSNPEQILHSLGWVDMILFLITILGYSGYIPRTLWFIANKGGVNR